MLGLPAARRQVAALSFPLFEAVQLHFPFLLWRQFRCCLFALLSSGGGLCPPALFESALFNFSLFHFSLFDPSLFDSYLFDAFFDAGLLDVSLFDLELFDAMLFDLACVHPLLRVFVNGACPAFSAVLVPPLWVLMPSVLLCSFL